MRRIFALLPFLSVAATAVGCIAEASPDDASRESASAVTAPDVRRTVVYVFGQTQPGQDMFVRGGLDYAAAKKNLGYDCVATPDLCAIPIKHRSTLNATTAGWKKGDTLLDWRGPEAQQGKSASGVAAQGSPLDWTSNYWPSDWGPEKTIDVDGYGVDPMNNVGPHYWKLDVDMDCSKAFADAAGNRWFELKSFISNGPGWESDVHQAGAPYASNNHFAQCGKINVFSRGSNDATIYPFVAPKSISCAGGTLDIHPTPNVAGGSMTPWELVMSDQAAIDYLVAQSQTTFDYYDPTNNCGSPFHATITRRFPWSVRIDGQGSARKLVASDLYTYTNGGSFGSGQYAVQVQPKGDGFEVVVNGVDMPCSHSAAGYEVGRWTFPHCVATN